nr:hypothetical protein [Tanacetum cinerariifolium]
MTRSSTKELFTPFKEPKQEFRSSRKLLKTLSLDESRSPEFNLFFDSEEYSEEKVTKTMIETMQQDAGVILFYTGLDVQTRRILDSKCVIQSKTAANAKVAIQEMVEYSQKWHNGTSRTRSTKTSNGLVAIQAQLNNLRREIKKVNEKIDVFKRKITLMVGDEKIIFESVKPASSLIEKVYMLSLRERMELDLEARPMGKTLVLNSEFNPIHNEDLDSTPKNDRFDTKSYLLESLLNRDESIPSGIDNDESDSERDNLFLERLLHDDHIPLPDTLDFSYDVRVFLPFFTYPVTSSTLLSSGSEDTIFDPGIYRFSSLEPGLSHRCGTFKKFNTHRSHLNESPMKMLFSTCSPMDR